MSERKPEEKVSMAVALVGVARVGMMAAVDPSLAVS